MALKSGVASSQQRVFSSKTATRPCVRVCGSSKDANVCKHTAQTANQSVARREVLQLASAAVLAATWGAVPGPARADGFGFNAVRAILRPDDVTPEQAVVILLDARSVLKEISALAATPQDSQERFEGRRLWPGFAGRLREVGPAAPVVASIISGTTDKEETLSELYGGKATNPGVTDAVYLGLGKVLTISGRTIRNEAQAEPGPADEARAAIEDLLTKVPKDIYDKAQEFRVKRAEAAEAKAKRV